MATLALKTAKNGKGVFANKNFKRGDFIMQFKGKVLGDDDIEFNSYEDEHCIQIEKRTYLGPSGEWDDFVNHSCNPNCGVKNIGGNIHLIAIKDIKKGKELTFDYSTWSDYSESAKGLQWTLKCNCKSRNCRKKITDFKYLPVKCKEKYIKLGIVPHYILNILKKFK